MFQITKCFDPSSGLGSCPTQSDEMDKNSLANWIWVILMGGFQGRSENKNWKCLHKLISSEMHSCVGMRPWNHLWEFNYIVLNMYFVLKSSNLWISHVVSSIPSIFLHPNVFGIVKLPKYTSLFKSDGDNIIKLKSVVIKGSHQSRTLYWFFMNFKQCSS